MSLIKEYSEDSSKVIYDIFGTDTNRKKKIVNNSVTYENKIVF